MDRLLALWMSWLIEWSKLRWMLGQGNSWRPGEPLDLLFAGYNGARNTGADVRVEEMLRQVRHVLGDQNVRLSVMTQDKRRTDGYFSGARQIEFPDVFPPFLYREIPRHHGVITCEGSMFKSKFANALSIMMVGALGIAAARNRLSIGYGAEAGRMDRYLRRMCRRYCGQSMVITRNDESRDILRKLGIATDVGTDTAWTFQPRDAEYGRSVLRSNGWDGKVPILAICPINPFWWPVKASLVKAVLATTTGVYKKSRYRSVYFHNAGPHVERALERYLSAIAGGVRRFAETRAVFPIMVAMERLDESACRSVAMRLGGAPVFTSDAHNMYELVSILRCADMMVSSRYHGIVTAMPGRVPSAGITMDERIANLLTDRGHRHLLLTVDDPELEDKLVTVLDTLATDADAIRDAIGRNVVKNLRRMARMGAVFQEQVQTTFPQMQIQNGLRSWESFLPPMHADLEKLIETHGG